MNKEEIKVKIKDIMVDRTGVEAEQVTDDAHFENNLGMDSLDKVELLMEIEKEFKISIPDDEAEKAYTLNDCVEIVEKMQNGSKS